ncbi:MAG TPA: sigma-E factor negative regulatory protein [Rhodanobacteraceae bacterium]|nr:sigma-E factor negative regulatory protein [Rhodanobacteraceae bacterium]
MDSTSREDLSALMDGELAAEPTRFLLRRLDHDPELGATWSRWHLIRACLASDTARMSTPKTDSDFAARVAAALTVMPAPRARRRHWAQYVGGTAIAAGVAVAALMLRTPVAPGPQPGVASETAAIGPARSAVAQATQAITAPQPWLLPRQPTVLGAQPASANVIYGTGLMQPDYLRRAAYAQDAAVVSSYAGNASMLPFPVVVLPAPASSAAGARR